MSGSRIQDRPILRCTSSVQFPGRLYFRHLATSARATAQHVLAPAYDRINLIAGTKGIFRDYPPRIYLDGSPREEFGPIDP
jgi:hypothetical protein